jgi:uncharacterized protein (TIGR00730 family)
MRMTPPDNHILPKITDEHGVSERAIQEQELFELEMPERSFLSGPRSRFEDLKTLIEISWDFLKAFRVLHFIGPCVTIFGSARVLPGSAYYELTKKMAAKMADMGFTVITGGGPGIMEAGNRGAYENGGRSVGVNIQLPFEQGGNPYVDRDVTMKYFFTRKTILIKYSYAFIVMPGGFGTLDEMFEILTLIQTGKVRNFPVVLMGKSFWQPLIDFIDRMMEEGMLSSVDPDLIFFTDDIEDAAAHIQRHAIRQFGLRKKFIPKSYKILGEKSLARKKV